MQDHSNIYWRNFKSLSFALCAKIQIHIHILICKVSIQLWIINNWNSFPMNNYNICAVTPEFCSIICINRHADKCMLSIDCYKFSGHLCNFAIKKVEQYTLSANCGRACRKDTGNRSGIKAQNKKCCASLFDFI
mgnify:CR=1 FL=1